MNNKAVNVYADYDYWFSKNTWALDEAVAIVIGLNPQAILSYKKSSKAEPLVNLIKNEFVDDAEFELDEYSSNLGNWADHFLRLYDFFLKSYQAGDLRFSEKYPEFKPWYILQWCWDNTIPFHYDLTAYLERQGFDFRFSGHSAILASLATYAKKDIWHLPVAARLIVGVYPDCGREHLRVRKNFYRHLDPNTNFTKRDEVYEVLEVALESWKTSNLEFFEYDKDDPEAGYYSEEDCCIEVESKKIIDWAIKKGFQPPIQLLEMMGLQEEQSGAKHVKGRYTTPYMEIMLEAIEVLEITNDNQPAKQTIVDWLKEKNSNLSGREIEYLATFVRTPDMKKGGFYKGKSEQIEG